jgi:hypothetical protein
LGARILKAMQKCKEIVKEAILRGYVNQIHRKELENIICLKCGIDKRTIQNWIRALTTLGFISEINPNVFKINLNIDSELLSLAIKNGQKKLL